MKKILSLIIMALFVASMASAKDKDILKHEISFIGAAGQSALKYNNSKNGFGGALGLEYSYPLTNKWSIGTGLEFSFYNAKTTNNSFSEAYDSNDGQYNFEFRTTVSNYQETQKATYLNIPVMAQFQMPIAKDNQFYAAAGLKFGIPLASNYKMENASIKNSGYYPIWSNEQDLILETQEFMGFGTFNRKNIEGDLGLKLAYMLSIETGLKWKLSKILSFYTGAYLDYGLNDVKEGNSKHLIQYNVEDPSNFISNSLLQTNVIDKVAPMAIGVKFRLGLRI
jgi:opacity protein-like surface antigen